MEEIDAENISIPGHVWWLIFSKFKNPSKILRLRRVSSDFKALIEQYFEEFNVWEKLCENNIKQWRYQISTKVHLEELIDVQKPLTSKKWRDIFLYYCKWRSSSTFDSLAAEVQHQPEEEITCTTVWKNAVIAGSKSGNILWTHVEERPEDVSVGFINKKGVEELKAWRAEVEQLVLVAQFSDKSLKFFDLIPQTGNPLSNPLDYYGTNICVGIDNRLFIENNYRITEFKFSDRRVFHRRTCDVSIFVTARFNSQFLSMHSENDLLVVKIKTGDEIKTAEIFFSNDINEDPRLLDIKVFKIDNISRHENFLSIIPIKELGLIFFGNELVACSKLLNSGKGCNYYELSSFKDDVITCAAMYANILFLGWNSGLFSKIFVNGLEDFLNFNNPPHSKSDSFQLDINPIIAINLTECEGVSYIVATTKDTQYIIRNNKNKDYDDDDDEVDSERDHNSDEELSNTEINKDLPEISSNSELPGTFIDEALSDSGNDSGPSYASSNEEFSGPDIDDDNDDYDDDPAPSKRKRLIQ